MHTKNYLFKVIWSMISLGEEEINITETKSAKPEDKRSVDRILVADKLKKIHLDIRKTNP